MDSRQIIYPTERLLANPRIFMAIADYFDGPDWETFRDAFYDLLEGEFEDMDVEPEFAIPKLLLEKSLKILRSSRWFLLMEWLLS